MLAEARETLGGRVVRESTLPGLSSYIRVRDYRVMQLQRMPNVQIFPGDTLSASDIVALEIPHVFIATGAHWRRDGVGRYHHCAIDGIDGAHVLTPDDICSGLETEGKVVIYDDDHYFMGGVIAEKLRATGIDVTLVTPEPIVSSWTVNTLEQDKIQTRLLRIGVKLIPSHAIVNVEPTELTICGVFDTSQTRSLSADTVIAITSRVPDDTLYRELMTKRTHFKTLQAIGDCEVPGTVAAAVYAGHSAARSLESEVDRYAHLFRREIPSLG